jgi:hypothetical protein
MSDIIFNISAQLKNNRDLSINDLNPLKLDKIEDETFFTLLVNFLTLAFKNKNDHNIRIIIDYFEEGYNFTSLSIILYLMVIDTNEELMKYILNLYTDKTYKTLMIELISWDSRPEIFDYLQKLEYYFPDIKNAEYKELYTYALEGADISNTIIIEYLSRKLEDTSHGKSKPFWILPSTMNTPGSPVKTGKSVNEEEMYRNVPDVDTALDIIGKKLELDKKLLYKQFAPEYRLSTLEEKKSIILGAIQSTSTKGKKYEKIFAQENIDLDIHNFRTYGPLNHFDNDDDRDDSVGGDPCSKHGGCRMLTCNDFATYDNDQDLYNPEGADRAQLIEQFSDFSTVGATDGFRAVDEELIDWFTGVCQECHEKILKKHYALRIPQLDGGWKGCYCSFECMENDTEDLDTFSSRMKTQLQKYGIYDS